ncbi:hypothetical protein KL86CLO1_10408 [uncultured Eubacteriales bacterium]|uniref:Uncharacterized protein n=1 Tax=uncultured Eubacteriales bacterium TaxID=172733 RepID=A0A212J2G9_9FIRM|nr:hypothetical protein KL86CLO1_10408 [uncultured Eubacteriales bacterium]
MRSRSPCAFSQERDGVGNLSKAFLFFRDCLLRVAGEDQGIRMVLRASQPMGLTSSFLAKLYYMFGFLSTVFVVKIKFWPCQKL